MSAMKKAGIREARQSLTTLIEEVQKGYEIIITDRNRPVARLVPPKRAPSKPFASHAFFRKAMPRVQPPLSRTILEDREDRL